VTIVSVPYFKWNNVGDQSFCVARPRAWNSLALSLSFGNLAGVDATLGSVFAAISLPLTLNSLSFNFSSLRATTVLESMGNHIDSLGDSVHATKTIPSSYCHSLFLCILTVNIYLPHTFNLFNFAAELPTFFVARLTCTVLFYLRTTQRTVLVTRCLV